MRFFVLLLLISFLPLCSVEVYAQEGEEVVAVTAKQKYKYTIYHMGAKWCAPCMRMKYNVWPNDGETEDGRKIDPNDDMKDFLDKNRIRLFLLDDTVDKHRPYFKKYSKFMRKTNDSLINYPTILIFSNDDRENPVLQRIGALDKSTMMGLIKTVLKI